VAERTQVGRVERSFAHDGLISRSARASAEQIRVVARGQVGRNPQQVERRRYMLRRVGARRRAAVGRICGKRL